MQAEVAGRFKFFLKRVMFSDEFISRYLVRLTSKNARSEVLNVQTLCMRPQNDLQI